MGAIASQITSLVIVYSTVFLGADQRKHQSSVSLAFVRGIHRGPVNSPRKGPVTRKLLPFGEVIMQCPRVFDETFVCSEVMTEHICFTINPSTVRQNYLYLYGLTFGMGLFRVGWQHYTLLILLIPSCYIWIYLAVVCINIQSTILENVLATDRNVIFYNLEQCF